MSENSALLTPASGLLALNLWGQEIGKTPATIWRWRQRGWIEVLNICGRLYISRAEIQRFERRAAAGEFSKVHKTPTRHVAGSEAGVKAGAGAGWARKGNAK